MPFPRPRLWKITGGQKDILRGYLTVGGGAIRFHTAWAGSGHYSQAQCDQRQHPRQRHRLQ